MRHPESESITWAFRLAALLRVCRTATVACVLTGSLGALAQMSIPGQFAVSPSGAATYTLPIQVPSGVAGIEPNLALTYNSQAHNGPVGVGWNLSGLSTIRRCPQNIPQDNARKGVNYSYFDRFCLDGQRLMLTSGTYGVDGAQYRTEIDSLTKVTEIFGAVIFTNTDGYIYRDDSFIVKTKTGLTLEYGNTRDSRVGTSIPNRGTPTVSLVRVWALNKISDSKGNTLTVQYTKDNKNGDTLLINGGFYPSRIDYTSNPTTGLAATSSVIFNYDLNRTDIGTSYEGGQSITNRSRLNSITTQTAGVNVLTYSLAYETGPGTQRTRLKSVTTCGATGQCLPPTTMAFAPEPSAAITVVSRSTAAGDTCLSTCGSWKALDVNGDGRTDLVHFKNDAGQVSVWLSNGDGTFIVSSFTSPYSALTAGTWQVLDLNGDGLPDLLHLKDGVGNASAWISNGNGTFWITSFTSTDTPLTSGSWQVLDLNGDGLADLVHIISGRVTSWLSNGNGTFAVAVIPITTTSPVRDQIRQVGVWLPIDVNADGLMDLVHLPDSSTGDPSSGYEWGWFSNGDGSVHTGGAPNPSGTALQTGVPIVLDVNGDGLADFMRLMPDGSAQTWMAIGASGIANLFSYNGSFAFASFGNSVDTNLVNGSWQIVDFNGDGRADLLHLPGATGTTQAYIWISKGDGTFTQLPVGTGDPSPSTGRWLSGDFVGDGVTDVVHMANDSGLYVVWSMPRGSRDVPSSIDGGLGNKVGWTTSTLPTLNNQTNPAYTRELPNSASTLTIIPPLSVVNGVDQANGLGGTRHTTYSYDSARVERNGRGFLGFNWVQSIDGPTQLVSRNYYRLDFPYIGMVKQSGRGTSTSAWNNLNLTTNDYGCLDPASPPAGAPLPCTVAAGNGKGYLVYSSKTVTVAKDLDGTTLPRSETVNQNVDVYGNVGTAVTSTFDATGVLFSSKTITNTYFNDPINWYFGRLLTSAVVVTGPNVLAPVTPGSAGLPGAPPPTTPTNLWLPIILNLLLND